MKKRNNLSYLAHDLKTPINSIKELIEIAKKTNDIVEIANCLDIMDTNISYLDVLVHQILDITRFEQDKLIKNYKHFTISSLVAECNKIIKVHIDKKQIDYNYNVVVRNNYVKGDYMHILQILINIFSNSIKFTKNNGKIDFIVKELRDGMFLFEITDNGCGMSNKFQKKAFEPYAQENPHIGNGLGLTITKKLVSLLDGSITFESVQDVKTSFSIILPLEVVHKDVDLNLVDLKFLLVDDNEIIQAITSKLLKENLAFVDQAFDGEEALKLFNNKDYDIILLDVMLPGINGFEVLNNIKNSEKYKQKNVPIIAMTATDNVEVLKYFDNYLIKPVKKDDLFTMIKKYKA